MKAKRKPALITDARTGPGQDRRRREIEYAILQGMRLPPLVLCCIFFYLHWWVAAAIAIGITIPLPWIAVMLGNSKGQVRDERERMTYKPAVARRLQEEAAARQEVSSPVRGELTAGSDNIIDHEDIHDDHA